MTIPTLKTARLILRGYRNEDFPALVEPWADPRTTCLMGMKPMTEEDVWAKYLRSVGSWEVNGFGFWAVEERSRVLAKAS
jgi:RimJ/RimL family protein N-acetyltransferase